MTKKQRLVVGISGSSGAILGIRLLEKMRQLPVETHLVVTPSARLTIEHETRWPVEDVLALADAHYRHRDIGAPIASGSFDTLGMVVIPCSIKSLSAIANSYSGDLLTRAADVTLKEGRPLLLVVREAPLHAGHIRLMELASRAGAVIFPPVPAFYTHPQAVDEIVDNIVGRVLRRLGIENPLYHQWAGAADLGAASVPEPVSASPAADAASAALPLGLPFAEAADLWALPALTLATSGPDGAPHAATVYFAPGPGGSLYFFSAADSQHSQDLAVDPRAAASIDAPAASWQDIRGLQLRGTVRVVAPGEEWQQAWARYLVKFPFAGGLEDIVARNTLYAFRPGWARLVDNRRGFGFKEEWTQP